MPLLWEHVLGLDLLMNKPHFGFEEQPQLAHSIQGIMCAHAMK